MGDTCRLLRSQKIKQILDNCQQCQSFFQRKIEQISEISASNVRVLLISLVISKSELNILWI